MRLIWKKYIPPKFSFILWLSLCGRLYTKNNWLTEENKCCSLCKSSLETIDHLFFRCTFVHVVWLRIRRWIGITRDMNTIRSAAKWIKKEFRGALIKSKAVLIAFATTVYMVWKIRNEVTFASKTADVSTLVSQIQYKVYSILYNYYPVEAINF